MPTADAAWIPCPWPGVCASPEGFGGLERYDATLIDAFTKALQMLLQQARRRRGEPVTLEAVTLRSGSLSERAGRGRALA